MVATAAPPYDVVVSVMVSGNRGHAKRTDGGEQERATGNSGRNLSCSFRQFAREAGRKFVDHYGFGESKCAH